MKIGDLDSFIHYFSHHENYLFLFNSGAFVSMEEKKDTWLKTCIFVENLETNNATQQCFCS